MKKTVIFCIVILMCITFSSCTINPENENEITIDTTSDTQSSELNSDNQTDEVSEESIVSSTSEETEDSDIESQEISALTSEITEESKITSASETQKVSETEKKADDEDQQRIQKELEAVTTTATSQKVIEPDPINIYTAKHPETNLCSDGSTYIDVSNASQGYVCIKNTNSTKRLKVQIKTDSMTYNYDLNNNGNYEVFPLQMGNAKYTIRVLQNVSGTSYSELYHTDINVTLDSSLLPFLYNNQYVNFSYNSEAIKKSYELCAGCTTDIDKLKVLYSYMTDNIKYDNYKAQTVKSGYIPDPDAILASKKGICFDYASLLCVMLRAQRIPSQLVIGSAGSNAPNHAWNEVYLQNIGWITISIENTKQGWKLMDATFGAGGYTSSSYTAARIY